MAVARAAVVKAERRQYRQLRHRKVSEFWRNKLEAELDPQRIWWTVDVLRGRGRPPASSAIDVGVFNQFFADQVARVRSSTSGCAFSRLQSDTPWLK